MKRNFKILFFTAIVSILLVLGVMLINADEVATASTVTASSTTGSLTWTLTDDGTLTISGQGAMTDYSYSTKPWYNYSSTITNVVIENGVTSIGDYAFSSCYSLTSITIPDSVTSIGDEAFSHCESLTSITIGNGVTSIGYGAFRYCESLTSITIPDSITSIGDRAFSNCESLTSITIPVSVTSIDSYAFSRCDSLTSITIPDSVTRIGEGVFSYCDSLTSITIPDSVTSIGDRAFYECSALKTVYYFGTQASWNQISIVSGNAYLTNAEIIFGHADGTPHDFITHTAKAPTCTESGWAEYVTCSKCDYSTYEEIPPRHDEVSHAAKAPTCTESGWAEYVTCSRCNYSTYEEIPAKGHSVSAITIANDSKYPFALVEGVYGSTNKVSSSSAVFTITATGTTKLTVTYSVSSEENWDNLIINKNGSTLVTPSGEVDWTTLEVSLVEGDVVTITYSKDGSVDRGSDTGWFTISDSGNSSEPTCTEDVVCSVCQTVIKEATGHSYVGGVCENCGERKSGAQTIVISPYDPTGLKGFENWENIYGNTGKQTQLLICTTIEIPVNYIWEITFDDGVTTNTITRIPDSYYDTWLRRFEICIGDEENRFVPAVGVEYMISVKIYDGETLKYESDPCGGFICGEAPIVPEEEGSFIASGTTGNLSWIITSDGVLTISGQGAMPNYDYNEHPWKNYSSTITNVVIENGVTSIGDYAFFFCRSLTSITIPDSITSIGKYAVSFCSSLTSITIGNGVTSIGDRAFYECRSLTSITIPDGVTSIGYGAFRYCESLTSITIPDSVTSIGDYAFSWCESLTSITIGNGVTSIGDEAFYVCRSLTSITIPESVTSIGYYAFNECHSLTSITIPDSVTSIGMYAFSYCSSLKTVYYTGTQASWNQISIGSNNTYLTNAEIIFVHADGTPHDFITHTAKAPTCTENGWNEYVTCSGCDYTTYEEIPAGHNFVDGACTGCGIKNGLVAEDGGYRFYVDGVAQYGWVDTDGDGVKDSYFYVSSKLRCEEDRMLSDGVGVRRFYEYNPETGFMTVVNGLYTNENGTQYFRDGLGVYGWVTPEGVSITDRPGYTVSGAYYFAYGDGLNFYRVETSEKTIAGIVRVFDENHLVSAYTGWHTNCITNNPNYYVNGVLQQGWVETEEGWVYFSRSERLEDNVSYGDALHGWQKIGGKVYYFQVAKTIPAFVLVTTPNRALNYEGYRDVYQINQTPENGTDMVGADYYIINPPAGF